MALPFVGAIVKTLATSVIGKLFPGKPKGEIDFAVDDTIKKDTNIQATIRKFELEVEDLKDRRELIKTALRSEDPYVRRARPTFLWVMYVILIANYLIFPAIGVKVTTLPSALLTLFGSAFIGYGVFRSADKKSIDLLDVINKVIGKK